MPPEVPRAMSEVHADDVPMTGDPHGTTDHGGDHGHDDHAHLDESEALGPIDQRAWGALVLGAALGLAVALGIALSTTFLA
jgi:hypothetical protein